jgi:tripartite-type tricarboxylate transporter receptor subunit TctC
VKTQALFFLALALACAAALAEAKFPAQSVQLIVPYPPGGSNDILARAIGKKLTESGVPGYSVELWWGVLAPAGTPREKVAALNAAINRVLAMSEMKEFMLREGAEPAPGSPEEFAALLRAEIGRWRKLARYAGIQAE